MATQSREETLVETTVTYAVEVHGEIVIIENVPARVCVETGERYFSPATVERIQELAWKHPKPHRVVQTPVYDYAA